VSRRGYDRLQRILREDNLTNNMTRVLRRATSAGAARARSRIPKPRVRKHKIIMESITQEKKKLRSVVGLLTSGL
jgi:hypothetical protein